MKSTSLTHNNKLKTSKSSTSPRVRRFFQGKNREQEEEHLSLQANKKQSVLSKVKEKARKWRQTLVKKKQGNNGNRATSWGVAYEDYEKDENPQSNHAYEDYEKDENPQISATYQAPSFAITEKHVIHRGYSDSMERSTHDNRKTEEAHDPAEKEKHSRNEKSIQEAKMKEIDSEEIVREVIEMDLSSLKVVRGEKGKTPTPSPEEGMFEENQGIDSPVQEKTLAEAVTEKLAPVQRVNSEAEGLCLEIPLRVTNDMKEGPVIVVNDSDEEYENEGEDKTAISRVISEAMNSSGTPGDMGVMEKVKEAVTLLLQAEQQQEQEERQKQQQQQQEEEQEDDQEHRTTVGNPNTSVQAPVIVNAHEELKEEEECHGNTLQAN